MAETIQTFTVTLQLFTNKRSPSETLTLEEDETVEAFADRVREQILAFAQE